MALRPPGVDEPAWRALVEAVGKQARAHAASARVCGDADAEPAQPSLPYASVWRTHSRLKAALADEPAAALVLAHDHLVLPWFCVAEGEWRNLPRGPGVPCAVKRFLAVPSLALWLRYEARLSPAARCFYEVLRERTPVRYWLDCDLPLTAELLERLGVQAAAPQDGTPAERCRDRLAQLLERHVSLALCTVMDAQPVELRVLSVNGDGGCAATSRISLHVIATGALLPDNEHAAAAVRLAVIDSIRAAARTGDDAVAAALALCTRLETTIDAVNTRNRLRRMTGHTKIGQRRNSAPLPRHASLPVDAFFVSAAAAAGAERVLQWRAPPAHSWPVDGRQRQPLQCVPGANVAAAAPAAHAAILAELRAIPDVRVRFALRPAVCIRATDACAALGSWAPLSRWHRCASRAAGFPVGRPSPRAAPAPGARRTRPRRAARRGRCTAPPACTSPSTATASKLAAPRRATRSAFRANTRTPTLLRCFSRAPARCWRGWMS
jgi:hypothetical protein